MFRNKHGTWRVLLSPLVRQISQAEVHRNYLQVKQDLQSMLQPEVERVLHDPALAQGSWSTRVRLA
ncbi:hypothetical protein [Pontibacter kalidii]|uniref:hypothetical protein n=1 Tax=Pontibacter kalidii TaxID=2592049 RepID=UPI002259C453|nr:hypothetical protein [Pontibacter kalidii]